MILPGSTIGILGGGQLGRMLAQAAQTLGYRVHIYEPQANCPAGAVANREYNASYTDLEQLREFARGCDVVTYEFENIPAEPLREIESLTQLHPHWSVLEICQNRLREKRWLRSNAIPHVNFAEVEEGGDIAAAINSVGIPCVVKTADFGYDGKGQLKVTDDEGIARATEQFADQRAVVERYINFKCELSVVVARSPGGEAKAFPVA
jgi:5-(carboxyamino)imidazole ribonucleotide synthase